MAIRLIICTCVIFFVCWTTTYSAQSLADFTKVESDIVLVESRHPLAAIPLSSVLPMSLSPGVYESDDIEHILSFPLADFGDQDLIMFDIDQTLITQLDPYYHAHRMKNTPLNQKLTAQPQHIVEKFDAYQFISNPYTLMDEKIPALVRRLQERRVHCIANTAKYSTLPSVESVNVPLLKAQSLQTFGIDFSMTYPQLSCWDFNTIDAALIAIAKYPPVFKEGIILSSETPKHVTTLDLLKKLAFKPRRVAFIDDILDNTQEMYKALNAEGIECYSFLYSKAHTGNSLSYFPSILFDQHLIELEAFLDKLLDGGDVDEFFQTHLSNKGKNYRNEKRVLTNK